MPTADRRRALLFPTQSWHLRLLCVPTPTTIHLHHTTHHNLTIPLQISADAAGKAADALLAAEGPTKEQVLGNSVVTALSVPFAKDTENLLPLVWSRERFEALERKMPGVLPHCSLSGESPLPEGPEGDLAVVVCYVKDTESTTLMGEDLARWELTFTEALRAAMKNLQHLTKGEPLP